MIYKIWLIMKLITENWLIYTENLFNEYNILMHKYKIWKYSLIIYKHKPHLQIK